MLRGEMLARLRAVMQDGQTPRYTYPVADATKVRLRQAEGGDQEAAGGTTQPATPQSPGRAA